MANEALTDLASGFGLRIGLGEGANAFRVDALLYLVPNMRSPASPRPGTI